jgi:hypothetical protein
MLKCGPSNHARDVMDRLLGRERRLIKYRCLDPQASIDNTGYIQITGVRARFLEVITKDWDMERNTGVLELTLGSRAWNFPSPEKTPQVYWFDVGKRFYFTDGDGVAINRSEYIIEGIE